MDKNKSPQDILNEIFEKTRDPAPPPPQPQFEPPKEDPPPAPPLGKSRPRALSAYLTALFGAAFLILLLAYFVQRRGSTALSTAQAELLEEVQRLEEENEALQQDNELLNTQLVQTKEEWKAIYVTLTELDNRTRAKNLLDSLEVFIDTKDWLMAGTIVENYDWYFNSLNPMFDGAETLPSQSERYLELREKLLEQDIIILEQVFRHRWSKPGPDGESRAYFEQPKLRDSLYSEEDYLTAGHLVPLSFLYPTLPKNAAFCIAGSFPNTDSLNRLYSGAFQPSTVEWFEQIKAELTAQEYLGENEDGTIEPLIPYD